MTEGRRASRIERPGKVLQANGVPIDGVFLFTFKDMFTRDGSPVAGAAMTDVSSKPWYGGVVGERSNDCGQRLSVALDASISAERLTV